MLALRGMEILMHTDTNMLLSIAVVALILAFVFLPGCYSSRPSSTTATTPSHPPSPAPATLTPPGPPLSNRRRRPSSPPLPPPIDPEGKPQIVRWPYVRDPEHQLPWRIFVHWEDHPLDHESIVTEESGAGAEIEIPVTIPGRASDGTPYLREGMPRSYSAVLYENGKEIKRWTGKVISRRVKAAI